nr:immunoglobulin light chain junction region [Macaca mulatta]MOW51880.1 immunoglobulin light chain junction region [Macaca mulatta]MOW52548.1 immunoglobulin light chain junction region [Macaca mulatta]MOW53133.1 immunoglobulin light chain junction region [Macaca mulatta]MOW53764.1 immunoglobulin light chain junction region [Macaca mulatta]
CLQYIRDPYTF